MARCTNTNASTSTRDGVRTIDVASHRRPLTVVLAGSVGGAAIVALAFAVTTAAVSACSYVALRGPSDADPDPEVVRIATEDCGTKPFALCDAMAPTENGCTGEPDLGDASASSAIPTDVSFPLGCTVNIPSTYKTPQGECLVAYACRCARPGARIADGGSQSQWSCVR